MTRLLNTAFILTCVFSSNAVAALSWNLAADWSDAQNPNGVWTLRGNGGVAFTKNVPDYDPDSNDNFTGPQPAWADAAYEPGVFVPGHVPMWFKSLGLTVGTTFNLDAPAGRTGMHSTGVGSVGPGGVEWTSPITGEIAIAGDTWLMRQRNTVNWSLDLNGVPFTGGTLVGDGTYTSGHTFDFGAGSGGSGALLLPVSVGDKLDLVLFNPPGVGGEFVGVDFAIRQLLPGDANADGKVTGADYTIWAAYYSLQETKATWSQGDFNGDHKVTGADYTLWAANFTSAEATSLIAVPEPTTSFLLCLGVMMAALHQVSRCGGLSR